jgi:hypothetical protein
MNAWVYLQVSSGGNMTLGVDNNSLTAQQMVQAKYPLVHLIANQAGCRANTRLSGRAVPIVPVLNPDTEVQPGRSILIAILEQQSGRWAVPL